MTTPSELIARLLDAAFAELQHDTGPQDKEYVHQRSSLERQFRQILSGQSAALLDVREGWVPVGERLPVPEDGADFVPLLFCLIHADHPVCAGRYFPDEPKRRRWISLQGYEYPTGAITHWMPLPAPPVEPQSPSTTESTKRSALAAAKGEGNG